MKQCRMLFGIAVIGCSVCALHSMSSQEIKEITRQLFKPTQQVDEDVTLYDGMYADDNLHDDALLYDQHSLEEKRGKDIINATVYKCGAQVLIQKDNIGRMPLAACIAAGNPEACKVAVLHLRNECCALPRRVQANFFYSFSPLGLAMRVVSSPYHIKKDNDVRYNKRLSLLQDLHSHGCGAYVYEYREALNRLAGVECADCSEYHSHDIFKERVKKRINKARNTLLMVGPE